MANGVPSLPLAIVEHIQSFMSYKEATRSASVCSRLYDSWYSRKNVDIDECMFTTPSICGRVCMKIIKRYEAANLKIEKFTIRVAPVAERYYISRSVIEAAAKLGVIEMKIILSEDSFPYRIPHGIFESADLVHLSVVGGSLYLGAEIPVICTSLKFLSLLPDRYLNLGNDLMNCYVMRCPNLEILECRGHLLRLDFDRLGGRLHKLESLIVETLTFQDHLWFTLMMMSLPCLRSLTIRKLFNCHTLLIRNPSIEQISIEECLRPVDAILSLPRLRFFHFTGVSSSSFKFQHTLRDVVSIVNIVPRLHVANFLSCLHKLLSGCSYSKIFLSVKVIGNENVRLTDAAQDLHPVRVELLEIRTAVHDSLLVEGLLSVCDPHVFRYDYG